MPATAIPFRRLFGRALLLCAFVLACGAAFAPVAWAQATAAERLQVTDPYLELHTGPGRGYPVFHVVERLQWVEIELRHTDWYRVRAADGKVGWVERTQLETTLTQAGERKSFRDVLLDDYLRRKVELGAEWGHFSSNPALKLQASYNITEILALEAAVGQVQGIYSGTNFWQVDLLAQPWADRRFEPFFGIGVGKIDNIPNASLVSAVTTNANMANAMLGARYHVSQRLILRLDWTAYTAFIDSHQTNQYRAVMAGLSFFF